MVRSLLEIKTTIEREAEITRQDVYDVLKNVPGDKLEDKKPGVREFLESLPSNIKNKVKIGKKKAIDKIMEDLESYPA